jgi:hypothetical protein
VAIAVVSSLLIACATMRGRAADFAKQGRYVDAVHLYDQILRESPDDQEVKKLRADAQRNTLITGVASIRKRREAKEDPAAADELGLLLSYLDSWTYKLEGSLKENVDYELAAARKYLDKQFDEGLTTGALIAEEGLGRHVKLVNNPRLAEWKSEKVKRVNDAGVERCTTLGKRAYTTTPYTAYMVEAYCAHWGAHLAFLPPLPHAHAALNVTGEITGATPAENALLKQAIREAFEKSVWYWPTAPHAAPGSLAGSATLNWTSHPVTLSKNWVEEVPYSAWETYQESYQASEPYSDREPYTVYSRGRPHTEYRSVTKYQTVTKWRDRQRQVTRYRNVPRVFTYQASQQDYTYGHRITVRLQLVTGGPELVHELARAETVSGYRHGVTFGPAGVVPVTPSFPAREAWASKHNAAFAGELAHKMSTAYFEQYCQLPQYSAEEASRCAYIAHDKAPPAAFAALQELLGPEVAYLGALLAAPAKP